MEKNYVIYERLHGIVKNRLIPNRLRKYYKIKEKRRVCVCRIDIRMTIYLLPNT